MNQRLIASSALASMLALGLLSQGYAADEKASTKEKCYGVAKGTCSKLGGKTQEEVQAKK